MIIIYKALLIGVNKYLKVNSYLTENRMKVSEFCFKFFINFGSIIKDTGMNFRDIEGREC